MRRLPPGIRDLGTKLLGSVPVTIRSGPNAGCKWSLASAGRGYRTGTFEADRIASILALLRPGDRFWDIGAHKGYVSLAASRAVGETGRVLALEPATVNHTMLRRHLAWNAASNVEVLPVAVSDQDGHAPFAGPGSSLAYNLGRGDEIVRTRSIESLITLDGRAAPDVIKIDAEGSEAAILRGGVDHLSPGMLIWISVHERDLFEECHDILRGCAFDVVQSSAMSAVTGGADGERAWGGDKELLAIGPERGVSLDAVGRLPLFADRGAQAPV